MKIERILMNLGISSNLKGFNYIIYATEIIAKNRDTNIIDLYSKISGSSTQASVERNIRTAISKAYRENPIMKKIYADIPTNSAFLNDLVFNKNIIEEIIKENI